MTSALRNRLLLFLVLPLCALALMGAWLDYRSADEAAGRHDQRLVRLLPALADSVVAMPRREGEPPLLLLAPPVEEFLRQNAGYAGYSVQDLSGRILLGDHWVYSTVPLTHDPEFHSTEHDSVVYRVAVQRTRTGAGELVVALADGSDPRQQWGQQVLLRVLLPNLVLIAAAGLAIHWAVRQAFKPLVDLAEAVERRSPRVSRTCRLTAHQRRGPRRSSWPARWTGRSCARPRSTARATRRCSSCSAWRAGASSRCRAKAAPR